MANETGSVVERIARIERYAFWLVLPSMGAMLIAVYAGASSSLVVWLVSVALLSGGLWMGLHSGLRPLLTGKARLSFIVYSVPVPDPLARFVGALYLLMGAIAFLAGLALLLFGH